MAKRNTWRLAACALVLAAAPVRADDGFFHRLAAEARARLDATRTARLLPPTKLDVHWKPQRIGSLDLGAPLVALAAADLDGDGKAELYAVTSREVIALAVDRHVRELGRVAFGGEPAVPASRDVVGVAIVDGKTLVAGVSSWARELRVTWRAKALVAELGEPGFELCPGERAQLVAGRNFFQGNVFGVRCRTDLVDHDGHAVHVRGELSTAGKLAITIQTCSAGACRETGRFEYARFGVAFELADVDRDGVPEVIFAGAGAPGDPDELRVVTVGDDEKQPKLKKAFTAGGVAGIAVGDVDGDGAPDVIAAVRLVGATRIDLWRMN